ncbi:MAG: hypothetical protein NVS3B20_08720 [Polyangiales bacterium]
MKFSLVHTFTALPNVVADAMLDPEMPAFLLANHGIMEEVAPQERVEEGDVVRRKVRYRPRPIIKKVGPKEVPPEMLAFIEESSFDKKAMRGEFVNNATRPGVRKHLVNKGTMTLREVGGKTERTIEGTLEVIGLPFLLRPLAALAERIIYSEAQKLLDNEARCVEEFIAKK